MINQKKTRPVFGEVYTYVLLTHPEHEKTQRKSARVIRVLRPRLRAWASGCGPHADSQVETRKTRITRADFRWVFPIPTVAPPGHVAGVGDMECSRVLDKSSKTTAPIPILNFRGLRILYPIHRVMVNWDPPISRVLHLPGAIQKGNTPL
jgi:hypothetical protein